jgi:hypothetical protein
VRVRPDKHRELIFESGPVPDGRPPPHRRSSGEAGMQPAIAAAMSKTIAQTSNDLLLRLVFSIM